MNQFTDQFQKLLTTFGVGRTMVLSTAVNDKVSSRMMSVVQLGGIFYFQTDIKLRKYRELTANPHVALCIDNIQIEGICKEVGHPLEHPSFCRAFQTCFKGSYDAYSHLHNERLFSVTPSAIQCWVYQDGDPYIETFEVAAQRYTVTKYIGI